MARIDTTLPPSGRVGLDSAAGPGEPAVAVPEPVYTHLLGLLDQRGVFAVADGGAPQPTLGYSTAYTADALGVVIREPTRVARLLPAAHTCLSFLETAIGMEGTARGRRSSSGTWLDGPAAGPAWARVVAALAAGVRLAPTEAFRSRATRVFLRAAKARSSDLRSACLAALGAAPLAGTRSETSAAAKALVAHVLDLVPRRPSPGWGWPEPRLGQENAVLCDVLIVGGAALGRAQSVQQGLAMLSVLMELETGRQGQLSPTGSHGRRPGEAGPLWVQRPAEAAAIGRACAHAFLLTRDLSWRRGVEQAWGWFAGANDARVAVYDDRTGACHDGIGAHGLEPGCGASATLAALATLQRLQVVSAEPHGR